MHFLQGLVPTVAVFIAKTPFQFTVMDSFHSATETSKWNHVHKFSTSSTLPWQKRPSHRSVDLPLQFFTGYDITAMELSRSSRSSSIVIFDQRALNVHVETSGSTTSAIAPGRSKTPLLLSAKFSVQSELNGFFSFFHLAVVDKIASYADVLRLVMRDKPKNVCLGGYRQNGHDLFSFFSKAGHLN